MLPSRRWLSGETPDVPDRRHEWAHCRDCGARIGWSEAACPSCGERQRAFDRDRNPRTAAALSAVIPGSGQLYTGELRQAAGRFLPLSILVGAVALVAASQGIGIVEAIMTRSGPSIGPIGAVELLVLQWLTTAAFSAHNAARQARLANYGLGANGNHEHCPDCDAPNPAEAAFCRNCGVEFPEPGPTETTYRFVTRGGVCFCEECNAQVSPADRACPACDYALRVEEPIPA